MPLLYCFNMTHRVFKTGSPSVRFYYLLTVCCAYPEVSLRGTMVVKSQGSGGVFATSVLLARSTLWILLSFIFRCRCHDCLQSRGELLLFWAFDAWFWGCTQYHVGQLENVLGTLSVLFVLNLMNWGEHTVEFDVKQGEIRQIDSCEQFIYIAEQR